MGAYAPSVCSAMGAYAPSMKRYEGRALALLWGIHPLCEAVSFLIRATCGDLGKVKINHSSENRLGKTKINHSSEN